MFICSICNDEFEGHCNKKYCSVCFDIKFGKICESCGNWFVDRKHPNQKKCSRTCGAKPIVGNLITSCNYCGNSIERYQLEEKENYFCTAVCALLHYSKNREKKKELYHCKQCGDEFERYIYRNTQFCSKKCAYIYLKGKPKRKKKKIQKTCLICNNPFKVLPSRKDRKYCKKCDGRKYEDAYTRVSGENHFRSKGGIETEFGSNWMEQRKKALKRDKYTCQSCGYIKGQSAMKVVVHHIIPRSEFTKISIEYLEKEGNKLSNLIVLCASCHPKVEVGNIKLDINHIDN